MSITKEQLNCLRPQLVSGCHLFSNEVRRIKDQIFIIHLLSGAVKLVVRYTPKVLDEMEARFEKQRIGRRNIK